MEIFDHSLEEQTLTVGLKNHNLFCEVYGLSTTTAVAETGMSV